MPDTQTMPSVRDAAADEIEQAAARVLQTTLTALMAEADEDLNLVAERFAAGLTGMED